MKHCLQELEILPHMTYVAMPCASTAEQKVHFLQLICAISQGKSKSSAWKFVHKVHPPVNGHVNKQNGLQRLTLNNADTVTSPIIHNVLGCFIW